MDSKRRLAANAVNAAWVKESCPSGDEGGGSRLAQRCWSVTCFGSGKVGDEGGGFLAPTASHFDS